MNELIAIATTLEKTSASYKILKKIPIIREFLMYREHEEKMDQAISEKIVNEYRLLNDPKAQIDLINSIDDPELKKIMVAHLIAVKEGEQKSINFLDTFEIFMNNINSESNHDYDDNELHKDWWQIWSDLTKLNSDPIKQEVFAYILDAELKVSGSINPRFLRLVADLSIDEIGKLSNLLPWFNWDGHLVYGITEETTTKPLEKELNIDFSKDIEGLLETGLIKTNEISFEVEDMKKDENGCFLIDYGANKICLTTDKEQLKYYYKTRLNKEGLMLKKILKRNDHQIIEEIGSAIVTCSDFKIKIEISE